MIHDLYFTPWSINKASLHYKTNLTRAYLAYVSNSYKNQLFNQCYNKSDDCQQRALHREEKKPDLLAKEQRNLKSMSQAKVSKILKKKRRKISLNLK